MAATRRLIVTVGEVEWFSRTAKLASELVGW